MNHENWKVILGYDNYEISDKGNIRNKNTGKILKNKKHKDGYARINLTKNNITKTFLIHRLVAIHFIKNLNNKPEIDHINGIRDDNSVSNLRWVTSKENSNTELHKRNITKSLLGNNRAGVKVRCIETGEIFDSCRDADRKYGLRCSAVRDAANPSHRQQMAGGYHWEYIKEDVA